MGSPEALKKVWVLQGKVDSMAMFEEIWKLWGKPKRIRLNRECMLIEDDRQVYWFSDQVCRGMGDYYSIKF